MKSAPFLLHRTVPVKVSRILKVNLFETYVFSRIFLSVLFWVASIGHLRKLLTFHKTALKWAFLNQVYNPLLCSSISMEYFTLWSLDKMFSSTNFSTVFSFQIFQRHLCSYLSFTISLWNLTSLSTLWITAKQMWKRGLLSVSLAKLPKLSELGLDIRDHFPTLKPASTKIFQQRTTFCFNERLEISWTPDCDSNHCNFFRFVHLIYYSGTTVL